MTMGVPLPPEGDTSWYDWATEIHAVAGASLNEVDLAGRYALSPPAGGFVVMATSNVAVADANPSYVWLILATPGAPVAAPSLSAIVNSATQITLTIGTVSGATSYQYDVNVGTPVTAGSPVAVTGLIASTSYNFRARAVNSSGNGPWSAVVAATTSSPGATVPGAPTIGTATGGNATASVTFTAPASNGGSAISTYTVTSSPGNLTATGAASPISVTGLTNGVAYTFTVRATNSVGLSAASAASNSVTPAAVAAFNVLTLPGLLGWHDASDASSLVMSGSNVTTWNDKSPNGMNLGAYATLTSPTRTLTQNGLSVVSFAGATKQALVYDAGSDIIAFPGGETHYMVVRIVDAFNNGSMIAFRTAASTDSGTAGHWSMGRFNANISSRHNISTTLIAGQPYGAYVIVSGFSANAGGTAGVSLQINNNAALTSATNPTLSPMRYASMGVAFDTGVPATTWSPFEGQIAERIICSGVHDLATRNSVKGYLSDKWGITL